MTTLTAPFNSTDTSQAAAASMEPHLGRLEELVFLAIKSHDDKGLTCDEVEEVTGLNHQTASARIHALNHKLHRIHDSGLRRKTRSGRAAIVYLANF